AQLAAGASTSVHVISATSAASCGSYSNSASASATNVAAASAGPVAITFACLSVTKTADAASVAAGSQIGYVVTVSNPAGNPTTTGLTATDSLPGGTGVSWSISGSAPGW